MLKLLNDFGEVSAQGGYSNPVHFDIDARFDEEVVQKLYISCTNGYTAKNVTLTDSGDTADRYQFSINGASSWADSVHFDCITANATCYAKARIVNDDFAQLDRTAKILLTYELKPATLPNFYYTNPGDANLLAVEDATTVNTTAAQSVTGKAFYGGQRADMFRTPDLQEVWIRLDIWMPSYNYNYHRFYIGHYGSSWGLNGIYYQYPDSYLSLRSNGQRATLNAIHDALNHITLHIKSGELIEMTANGSTVSWAGNVNNGEPLNNLVTLSNANDIFISNVVVSSGEINSACGWHREVFSLETHITAPVLNVRWQGKNHQFYPTTKRTTPALTLRVGDNNFYAPIVNGNNALASAVRLLLDDTNRALKT